MKHFKAQNSLRKVKMETFAGEFLCHLRAQNLLMNASMSQPQLTFSVFSKDI